MRLLPGVLGNEPPANTKAAHLEAGAALDGAEPAPTHGSGGLLDYPHYTRPAEFQGLTVPEVLSGGDHLKISRWRRERALEKTFQNRPDLLETAELTDRDFLASLQGS